MNVCVARPHLGIKYKGPFAVILDSFVECYLQWMKVNKQHSHSVWNCEIMYGDKQKRDPEVIKNSELILIPSESEYTHFIKGFYGPLMRKSYDEKMEDFRRAIEKGPKKKIVVLQFDLEDNRNLYENYMLKDVNNIDSIEFLEESSVTNYGVNALKYHNLVKMDIEDGYRNFDFAYWGTNKKVVPSGNTQAGVRHEVIRQIAKRHPKQLFVGRLAQAKHKFQPMLDLIPLLSQAKSSCCFNTNPTAITARYHECMGMGMIPFVWNDYDSNNVLNEREWQRVKTVDELSYLLNTISTDKMFQRMRTEVVKSYKKGLPSKEDVYQDFFKKMDSFL